jgi:Flp pilus assembly protein TadB
MSAIVTFAAPMMAAAAAIAAIRGLAQTERLARLGARPPEPPPNGRPSMSRQEVSIWIVAAASGWLVGRFVGLVLAIIAIPIVRRVRHRRANAVAPWVVEERTADTIGAVAAAVRAGSSLPQAIGYAATEAAHPVVDDLRQVVADLHTGVALDVALATWADRRRTADIDLLVGALELHRRSGGDLPVVLDQVVRTIRDRVSVAREVRSLTAQARLSAWILGLLPIGFFGFLWVTSRNDIEGALTTLVGLICVGTGLALEGAAFVWIRSLLEVG